MDTDSAIEALKRYRDDRQPLGDFLTAVLENNLLKTFERADPTSLANLKDIVMWVYWEIPGNAWGSPEAVKAWLHPEEKPTLDDYLTRVDVLLCSDCRAILPAEISHYEHQWGWPLAGSDERQWLYILCDHCGSQHALWKLGVPRPDHEAYTQPGSRP